MMEGKGNQKRNWTMKLLMNAYKKQDSKIAPLDFVDVAQF